MSEILKVGDYVRTKREFSGVPLGSLGMIIQIETKSQHDSYAVEWQELSEFSQTERKLVDWFSDRELVYLEKVIG